MFSYILVEGLPTIIHSGPQAKYYSTKIPLKTVSTADKYTLRGFRNSLKENHICSFLGDIHD